MHYLDLWVQATAAEAQFQAAFNRGHSATGARDWQTAADAYSEAIRVAPPLDADKAKAHAWRGNARIQLKDYSQAFDDFSEAIRLDSRIATAYHGRGYAWGAKKEYEMAIKDYDDTIRLDPKNASAINSLARLLATCPEAKYRDAKWSVSQITSWLG
jgi:tetratricopeptide (TPR) repeat protein